MDLPIAGNQHGRIHGAGRRQTTEGADHGRPESRNEEAVFKSRCGSRQSLWGGDPSPKWPPPHSVDSLQSILHCEYSKHVLGTSPATMPIAQALKKQIEDTLGTWYRVQVADRSGPWFGFTCTSCFALD